MRFYSQHPYFRLWSLFSHLLRGRGQAGILTSRVVGGCVWACSPRCQKAHPGRDTVARHHRSGATVYTFIDFSFLLKGKKSPLSSKRRRGFLKSSERYLMLKVTLLSSPSLSWLWVYWVWIRYYLVPPTTSRWVGLGLVYRQRKDRKER